MSPKRIHDSLNVVRSNPFRIRMSDGSVLQVPRTDYIIVMDDGEQAALFENGNRLKLIDTAHITAIEVVAKEKQKKSGS